MKNLILLLFSFSFILISCKHYKEDPWYSWIKKPEKRIIGSWEVKTVWIDGVDSTKWLYNDTSKILNWFYRDVDGSSETGGAKNNSEALITYTNFFSLYSDDELVFLPYTPFDGREQVIDSLFRKGILTYHGALGNIKKDGPDFWKIKRFTNHQMLIETEFKNHNYRQLLERSKKLHP